MFKFKMMHEIDAFIYNRDIVRNKPLPVLPPNVPVVYEVIRVIEFTPLFFDDHFRRMLNSCKSTGIDLRFKKDLLENLLFELSMLCKVGEGNIIIKVANDENNQELLAHFIPHQYPSANDYKKGVKLGMLEAERVNPGAKVLQSIRETANNEILKKRVYEVLLVDKNMNITEGSRSNFFFIKDNELYTAPLEKVLKGITLEKVIQLASGFNITVNYRPIKKTEIDSFDSAFLTGTSPKILPVSDIENISFNVNNKIMNELMAAYNKMIEENISSRKSKQIQ